MVRELGARMSQQSWRNMGEENQRPWSLFRRKTDTNQKNRTFYNFL